MYQNSIISFILAIFKYGNICKNPDAVILYTKQTKDETKKFYSKRNIFPEPRISFLVLQCFSN